MYVLLLVLRQPSKPPLDNFRPLYRKVICKESSSRQSGEQNWAWPLENFRRPLE